MPSEHRGPPARLPLSFEVDGTLLRLPDLDTRTWLQHLPLEPPGCWFTLIPGQLDTEHADHLWNRLRAPADPLDLDDLEQVATDVLGAAVGMDFWAAHRLSARLHGSWLAFDGWSYSRGLDPLTEPIGRVLAGGLTWLAQQCEKRSEVTKLEHDLWSGPPATNALGKPRQVTPTWADESREAAAWSGFEQLFGGRGGRG